ncbi:MAG: DUF1883 domain-containing protein [Defluviitaleaceae bacterium]|nr:DUF1883 domain-containing protein [Defluviitaleaceae bacterium]MCL2263940.1 DUF1883 domain-containing protein [Defluviitaleaceae bacterium]
MKFTHYDLKRLAKGEIVEITLSGSAANVQLLDNTGFQNYKNGRNYKYIGGLAKKSPIRLLVPSNGHWHVVVDMRGLVGTTRSSVRVLPSALPPMRERSLVDIPSLVNRNIINMENKMSHNVYDVFISHASEDKDEIVRPLAIELANCGLSVWYDEFEMKIGDSLRRKIDKGLANSKFGIVVISRFFIKKGWTNYELDGLITRTVSGEQILLPVWHNITKNEVVEYSPSLADKVARNTANYTIKEIAREIAEVINRY